MIDVNDNIEYRNQSIINIYSIYQMNTIRFPLAQLQLNIPKINQTLLLKSNTTSILQSNTLTNSNTSSLVNLSNFYNHVQSTTKNHHQQSHQHTIEQLKDKKKEIKVKISLNNIIHKFILKVENVGELVAKLKYQLYQIHQQSKTLRTEQPIIIGFQTIDNQYQLDYILSQPHFKLSIKEIQLNPIIYSKKRNKATLSDFTLVRMLGCGGFSIVYLVRGNFNNKYYAMKLIDKQFIINTQRQSIVQNQRLILNQLTNSKFITQMYFCFETLNHFVIVIEYCPGGQLFYQLKQLKTMTQKQAKFYFLEILIGLDFMHSKKIIYRDLKPQNLLIDSEGHIKIADFGLSKPIDNNTLAYSFCGSPEYMAPQMLRKQGHDRNLDYYCLGALLYQLVFGIPPYYSSDHQQIYHHILNKKLTFPNHIQSSKQLKSLLCGLLQKNTENRLGSVKGCKQILQHPWVGKVNRTIIQQRKLQPPFIPNLLTFNFDTSQIKSPTKELLFKIKQDNQVQNRFETYFTDQFYYQSQNIQVDEKTKKQYSLDYKTRKKSAKKCLKKAESLVLINKNNQAK